MRPPRCAFHPLSLAALRAALQFSCLLYSVFCILPPLPLQAAAVRPLAQNHVVLDNSPDPQNIPLYTPAILALPGGRLIAAHERSGTWPAATKARIYTSDDHGATWQLRAQMQFTHARLFKAGNSIYYLGHTPKLRISRSNDNGLTWSAPATFDTTFSRDAWHQSACNVLHLDGKIYLVMENYAPPASDVSGWSSLAPILMRADENADLTKLASWTFANKISFAGDPSTSPSTPSLIPGFRQNDMPLLNNSGIPFFTQTFPDSNTIAPGRPFAPMGWLETNVVHITDPAHPWYNPSQKTFHLIMRVHTGGTGYAALAKVTEAANGTLTTSLVQTPSGNPQLFIPLPGGQMRFHILQDPQTKLYWLLSSQSTDSLTRAEKLPTIRFDLPNNERHRLVLHFSKDLIHWNFAGVVAIGDSPREARHYACMDIDGDDIVVLSRSGDAQAKTAHNGNIITFHRVKNFRDLVY